MDNSETRFFHEPEREGRRLTIAPRLASWMSKDHPDQVRLEEFLDHAEDAVRALIADDGNGFALRLDVGLPADVDPLHQRDLDNYLFPLIRRLGPDRFDSVWANKAVGAISQIRIERSEERDAPEPRLRAVTTSSVEGEAWKAEIRSQISEVEEIARGPIELEIAFAVGAGRNWSNLWKPAIDSLTPLLGTSDPIKRWHPRDDRIVKLGLHRTIRPSLEHDVEIAVFGQLAASPP